MEKRYKDILARAKSQKRETKLLLEQFKKKKIKNFDKTFKRVTEDVFFDDVDCLECGNCCKALGPRINNTDIDRLAHFLSMRRAGVRNHYLKTDEDGDLVFKESPCPFIMDDNSCSVYKGRPRACIEYPHTAGKYMIKSLALVYENSLYCPAVTIILDKLKEEFKIHL